MVDCLNNLITGTPKAPTVRIHWKMSESVFEPLPLDGFNAEFKSSVKMWNTQLSTVSYKNNKSPTAMSQRNGKYSMYNVHKTTRNCKLNCNLSINYTRICKNVKPTCNVVKSSQPKLWYILCQTSYSFQLNKSKFTLPPAHFKTGSFLQIANVLQPNQQDKIFLGS